MIDYSGCLAGKRKSGTSAACTGANPPLTMRFCRAHNPLIAKKKKKIKCLSKFTNHEVNTMQKTTLNLAAIISAALLTACGGSSDGAAANALVPAPTEPNAAETAAFHASKQHREKADVAGNGDWQPYSISVNGRPLLHTSGDRSNAVQEHDFRSLPAGFAAYNGTYTDRYGSFPVKVRSY